MRVLTLVKTRSGHTTNYWVRYALECPPLSKTHSLFPVLLRATALRTCMGFGVFDCLKTVDCSFAENVSCRLSAAPPDNLCKFACGKLGADDKPILSVKPSLSVRLVLQKELCSFVGLCCFKYVFADFDISPLYKSGGMIKTNRTSGNVIR